MLFIISFLQQWPGKGRVGLAGVCTVVFREKMNDKFYNTFRNTLTFAMYRETKITVATHLYNIHNI